MARASRILLKETQPVCGGEPSRYHDQDGNRWWPFQPEGGLARLRCDTCQRAEPMHSDEQWWYNATANYVLCPRCKPRIQYVKRTCRLCQRLRRAALLDSRWSICSRCLKQARREARAHGLLFCVACLRHLPKADFKVDARGYPRFPICQACYAQKEVRVKLTLSLVESYFRQEPKAD